MHKELLEDIGEKELIKRLAKFMPKNQISDDCAFIKTTNKDLLINTDSLVENVHFNRKIQFDKKILAHKQKKIYQLQYKVYD